MIICGDIEFSGTTWETGDTINMVVHDEYQGDIVVALARHQIVQVALELRSRDQATFKCLAVR